MSITQAFGQVVRTLRMTQSLSQEELAERSGLHRNAIGLIERGERSPSIESLYAIARGLGIPASDLLIQLEKLL